MWKCISYKHVNKISNMENKIPQTKNEAFALLDAMLSEEEKSELAKSDPIEYHFSLGMWIRNS